MQVTHSTRSYLRVMQQNLPRMRRPKQGMRRLTPLSMSRPTKLTTRRVLTRTVTFVFLFS